MSDDRSTSDENFDSTTVVRRAPFSDNPVVGARGLRTQQRILDAALEVFGAVGYDRCSIDRIAKTAGCSRVSYYQYFSSKEDVFRQLAGQVSRQLRAATEALEPITADADGWAVIRSWVHRYAAVYHRYEPVFSAFPDALENDASLAGGSDRAGERNAALFQSKLASTSLPPRHLDPVVVLLLATVARTLAVARILEAANPGAYDPDRFVNSLTDVLHRTLFRPDPAVNARECALPPLPRVPLSKKLRALLASADITEEHSIIDKPALGALLTAGHEVLVQRGYHGARVDEIVAAAGVSRGAFYRYFRNRDHFTEVLAARALRSLNTALVGIPGLEELDGVGNHAALRKWLRRYNAVHVGEAAITRVWVDAALQDPAMESGSAAVMDWGRREMVRYLSGRDFGDVEVDGVVLIAFIDLFGGRPRGAGDVDAAAHIVGQGLLGR